MTPIEIRKYFASHPLTREQRQKFVDELSNEDWEAYLDGSPELRLKGVDTRKKYVDLIEDMFEGKGEK